MSRAEEPHRLERITHWFLPPHKGEHKRLTHSRAHLVLLLSALLFLSSAIFLLSSFLIYGGAHATVLSSCGGFIVCVVVLFLFKKTGSLRLAGHLLSFGVILLLGIAAFDKGGLDATAISLLPIVPLLAGFLLGRHASCFFAVLLCLLLLGLYLLHLANYPFPKNYNPSQHRLMIYITSNIAIAMTALLTWFYEQMAAQAQALAEERLEQLRMSNHKLLETLDQAESANRAKSKFLAHMSHELRTPINGILGMNELLLTTQLDPAQREQALAIRHSTKALLSVISDILDFSKIESGSTTVERVAFAPEQPLLDAIHLLKGLAKAKGLKLDFQLSSNLPSMIQSDPTCIQQILVNLINNAIKYTPEGRVTARVNIKQTGNQERLRFEVEDTGIGLHEELRDKLFEPFVQIDDSMTRRFEGVGLGLAICRELVRLLNGEIGVKSQEGIGSLFWFEIPFERIDHNGNHISLQDRPVRATLPTPTQLVPWNDDPPPSGARILVVEDDAVSRRVAGLLLERLKCQVDFAHNGKEAITQACQKNYDLILMDCRMPEIDGYEATRQIRAHFQSLGEYGPPIIAVTAHVLIDEQARCKHAGMDDYLSKPYHPQKLAQMLKAWLPHTE